MVEHYYSLSFIVICLTCCLLLVLIVGYNCFYCLFICLCVYDWLGCLLFIMVTVFGTWGLSWRLLFYVCYLGLFAFVDDWFSCYTVYWFCSLEFVLIWLLKLFIACAIIDFIDLGFWLWSFRCSWFDFIIGWYCFVVCWLVLSVT